MVCGNSTELTKVDSSRVPLNWGEDNLAFSHPGLVFNHSLAPRAGSRTHPDGKAWELIAAGFRNLFDLACDGEPSTYDADTTSANPGTAGLASITS